MLLVNLMFSFYEKDLQKTKQREFRAERVINNGKAKCQMVKRL